MFAAGPDFEYPLPELEGCPPARPVAELSGPPDNIAFPAPAGADTEPGEVHAMFIVAFMPTCQETMCGCSVLRPQHRFPLFRALCYEVGTFVLSFALMELVGNTGVTAHGTSVRLCADT